MKLSVEARNQVAPVNFNFVEKLGADLIHGCDFCDRHVEATSLRGGVLELYGGKLFSLSGN